MSEKEKMLAGLPYNSRDPELLERYHIARDLLRQYNQLNTRHQPERERLLHELLGAKDEGVWIEAPFFCDYGEHIFIGANTFINTNCIFLDDNVIRIGANGLIGPYVQIYTAEHPLQAAERIVQNDGGGATYLTSSQSVQIGDNAWIGGNTVIMPGVTIGNNVTIGAASLVTKSLPSDVLAFGNPCRVVRQL